MKRAILIRATVSLSAVGVLALLGCSAPPDPNGEGSTASSTEAWTVWSRTESASCPTGEYRFAYCYPDKWIYWGCMHSNGSWIWSNAGACFQSPWQGCAAWGRGALGQTVDVACYYRD